MIWALLFLGFGIVVYAKIKEQIALERKGMYNKYRR